MVVAALGALTLVALVLVLVWPWRVEATLKAVTRGSDVSVAGGVELFGFSGSAAAILGGPGVMAIHLRARELWRRPIAKVSLETIFDWLEAKPKTPTSLLGRLAMGGKNALLARTDMADLSELGVRVFLSLREKSMGGAILFGSSNPVVTGKTAAWLYPMASLLAPFGTIEVRFDWTGRNVLDGGIDVSFRVVLARALFEVIRFARSSTLHASSTT